MSPASRDRARADVVAYDATVGPDILDAWRRSVQLAGGVRSPCEGPEWTYYRHLRRFIAEPALKLVVLREAAAVAAVTPVMDDRFRLEWALGRRRLKGLRNSGSELLLPPSPETYETFLSALFRASDVDYLRVLAPHDDAFVTYALKQRRSRDWFVFVPHQGDAHYRWIDLSIGQEAYWAKFKKKQRYNFNRELQSLSSLGNVELKRIVSAEDAALFAKDAVQIAEHAWQYQESDGGATRADTDTLASLLSTLSAAGILRSYLLRVDGRSISFWTACQQDGTFWLYETGFDPEYAVHSPGKCMLQLIINDLFRSDTPKYLSFGVTPDVSPYKTLFATDTTRAADVLIIRNTFRNSINISLDRLSRRARSSKRRPSGRR